MTKDQAYDIYIVVLLGAGLVKEKRIITDKVTIRVGCGLGWTTLSTASTFQTSPSLYPSSLSGAEGIYPISGITKVPDTCAILYEVST